jgi:hypothetical protein
MRFRDLSIPIVALVLAVLVWRDAAVAYWSGNGQAAPALLQSDPRIASVPADGALLFQLLRRSPLRDSVDPIVATARAVLRGAPLEAAAMRQLGLAAAVSGTPSNAESQLALAERISRRDLPTQIALLDLAASAGDNAAALVHLDRLSTVSPRAGAQLFTPLAAFLADRGGRRQLVAYRERNWFVSFVNVMADTAEDPGKVAALLAEARLPRAEGLPAMQRLVDRLVGQNRYAAARDLALGYGGADPAALDDFRLTDRTVDPAFRPLTWRLADGAVAQAGLSDDGSLDVTIAPGKAALILDRATRFPPGSYVLDQQVRKQGEGADLFVDWQLRCTRADGDADTVAWRQPVPLRSEPMHYRSRLRIPPDCPLQEWSLTALADGVQSDAGFRIASITLQPATAD